MNRKKTNHTSVGVMEAECKDSVNTEKIGRSLLPKKYRKLVVVYYPKIPKIGRSKRNRREKIQRNRTVRRDRKEDRNRDGINPPYQRQVEM